MNNAGDRTCEELAPDCDAEFHRIADERWAALLLNGHSVPWAEAKAYLEARSRGESPARPVARRLRR